MSGREIAAAAKCGSVLPEDIIAEILGRVPRDVAFLFRCALVCKRWRRLLVNPDILHRLLPEAGRSSLLGFLVQRRRPSVTAWRTVANIFKSRVPAFVPAPGSALGPWRGFLNSFLHDDAGLLDNAEPLAARDGLVLLRVSPNGAGRRLFTLCVCRLLTGKLDLLPPLDMDAACFDDEGVRGYAILTSANQGNVQHQPANGYSNLCQVLLIGVHRSSRQLHIHSFSSAASALQNWSTVSTNCFPGDPRLFSGPYGRVAAVSPGTAHWLFEEQGATGPTMYTIDVNVDAGCVCASKITFGRDLPSMFVDLTSARLCLTIDQRLSLLYEEKNHLIIWTRQDVDQGATAVWVCTLGILINVQESWSRRGIPLAAMHLGEKSGTVLVLPRSKTNRAYLIDLQSRSTTKVAGWKRSFNYKTAVPYEINWPELFISRLNVQL